MENKLKVGDSFDIMSWYRPVMKPLKSNGITIGLMYATPELYTVCDYGRWRIPLHAFKTGKLTITKLK